MTVRIEASDPEISAVTGSDGNFTLSQVAFGTYTLIYEKAGYGTFKRFNLEHQTEGESTIILANPSLGQLSTTQILDLTTTISGNDAIASVDTDPPWQHR